MTKKITGLMRKRKFWNKKNIISAVIIFLMVSSVIGLMWGGDSGTKIKYNGYKFTLKDNKYWLSINNQDIGFNFHPADIENITLDDGIEEILNTQMAYLTFNPEQEMKYIDLVMFDFSSVLMKTKGIYIENAVTAQNTDYNLAVIDCENATLFVPVIKFELANETRIISEGGCVTAQAGDDVDIVKLKDRLLYGLLGII